MTEQKSPLQLAFEQALSTVKTKQQVTETYEQAVARYGLEQVLEHRAKEFVQQFKLAHKVYHTWTFDLWSEYPAQQVLLRVSDTISNHTNYLIEGRPWSLQGANALVDADVDAAYIKFLKLFAQRLRRAVEEQVAAKEG